MLMVGTAQIKVNNVAEYAGEDQYWVVRICDGEAWYYGSYSDTETANAVARAIDGIVVENEEV